MRVQYCAVSRLVVIPEYQGLGIGKRILNWAADYYTRKTRLPFFLVTSNPQLIRAEMPNWRLRRIGHLAKDKRHAFTLQHYKALSGHRLTATLQYCPPRENLKNKFNIKPVNIHLNGEEHTSSKNAIPWIFTAVIVLTASPVAIIFWRTLATNEPFWWPWVHFAALLALMSITFFNSALKPLRRFAAIMVVIFFLGYGGGWDWGVIPLIRSNETWILWMTEAPKAVSEIALHLLRLTPALIILSFLFLSGRKRKDFFLVKGDFHVNVEESRLLGNKKPGSWMKTALIFSIVFASVTFLFLIGVYGFPVDSFVSNWFLVPVGLLVATMNAFNEEFTLRAAPLGELEPAIGKSKSLVATAAYFGLGHYYGVPSGVLGVLLSGFLGWFLGKSMIETKGFFVAWLVHFITDIPIFLFFITGGI